MSEISEEELTKTYGGSATSAYMLLYRKFGSLKNEGGYKISDEHAPQEILESVKKELASLIEEQEKLEKKSREIPVHIYSNGREQQKIVLDKTVPLGHCLRKIKQTL